MLSSPILRALEQQKPASVPYIFTNPYRAKRLWPPDFSKLTQKQQFRLERRYRRRTKLKWARPGWVKATKLAQLGTIVFVLTYSILFLDWKQENQPFQGIRKRFHDMTGNIWSRTPERFQKRGEDVIPVNPVDGGRRT